MKESSSPKQRQFLEEDVFAIVESLQKAWKAYFAAQLETENVSFPQIAALHYIHAHQPVAGRKLGEMLHVTPGAVTQIVDGLVADGYVDRRENADDRRVIDLTLTPAGSKKLVAIQDKRRHIFVDIFSALSDQELMEIGKYQEKIVRQLEKLQDNSRKETK
jgi:DNA-binding MarR family transcriptional regulator